jgi:orotidine-5'-phosphate decarboxylase
MTKLIVAIDTPDVERARMLARVTEPYCSMVKFGSVFFTANGPDGIRQVNKPFFLDLKYHDIPTTIWTTVVAALSMKPYMLTVHASGGGPMIQAARDAAGDSPDRPLIMAVTRLTSLESNDAEVLFLARLALNNGADGLVCSPREISMLRYALGDDVKLIVPGIRPEGYPSDDQVRTMTPTEAAQAGADWIVVGRPITQAADPSAAAASIAASLR